MDLILRKLSLFAIVIAMSAYTSTAVAQEKKVSVKLEVQGKSDTKQLTPTELRKMLKEFGMDNPTIEKTVGVAQKDGQVMLKLETSQDTDKARKSTKATK
jgi:hypothetical protein